MRVKGKDGRGKERKGGLMVIHQGLWTLQQKYNCTHPSHMSKNYFKYVVHL